MDTIYASPRLKDAPRFDVCSVTSMWDHGIR